MGESKLITINWPNHHEVFVDGVWSSFLQNFKVDIEVTCNGQHLKAHQLILAIFCPALVSNSESQVFNLDHASLQGDDMDLLLEFIYRGQITLQEERLDKLQKAAKDLGVIGLGEAIDGYRTEGSKTMDEASIEELRSRRGANRRKRKNTPFKISQQAYDQKDENLESVSSEGDTSATSHGRKRFRGLHDKNDTDSNSDWNDNAEDNGGDWGSNAEDVHPDSFDHGISDGAVSQPGTPATMPKRKRGRKRSGKKLGEGEQSSSEPLSGEALKAARTEYKQKWRQNQPLRKCSFCNYETRDRDSFASHVAKHDPYAERHVCPFCSKSFRSRRGYIRHQSVHVDPASLQKCPQCPFMTPLKSSLIQHVASVHKADLDGNPIDGKFKCEECDFSSMFECQLKLHVLRKHSHERPFKCTECDYGAVLKTDLDKHISIKHRNERNFLCDLCGFCSSSKGGHNRHKRTHTGEKPFQCDICGKKYADSRKWKIHRLRHESDEKPFVCHVCAHACRRKDNLIMHLKRIHKIEKGEGGVSMSDECKSEEAHSRSALHTQTIVIVGPSISLSQTSENSRSANASISIPHFIAVDEEHSGEEEVREVMDVDSASIGVQTGPEQESIAADASPANEEPSNNATLDAEELSDHVAFYLYAASQELGRSAACDSKGFNL